MNGTAVMTALACLAYVRAEYLTRLVTRITALASFALDGNAHHFDATLFSVKPHPASSGWPPGCVKICRAISRTLTESACRIAIRSAARPT